MDTSSAARDQLFSNYADEDAVSPSPWIIEPTESTFDQDVAERSKELPVVVDFWAPWCGPCKTLGPMLENAAEKSAGKFLLAKIDIDKHPNLAASFGVQSVPTVVAVRDGKIADSFVGVLSETDLAAWLEGIQPSPTETLMAEAKQLEPDDPAAAEAKFREAVKSAGANPADDNLVAAQIGLARCLWRQGKLDDSQTIVNELEARGFLEPEAEDLQAELALKRFAAESDGLEACQKAAADAPDDRERQLDLAKALAGAQAYEEALDACLNLVRCDRQGLGEPAREIMLCIFRHLGHESDLTADYRRKLSSALY